MYFGRQLWADRMNIINTDHYRKAFSQYLRTGKPIQLSLKQSQATTQYVWRSRRDQRVRLAHLINDGRIFSWANPPESGNPGDDFNCRCTAEPYVEGETEFAYFEQAQASDAAANRWENNDFIWHFYFGEGQEVTLTEIGHLDEIIQQYAYMDGNEGVYRRLADQIADAARKGALPYSFYFTYDFKAVEFSHGESTVSGVFDGSVRQSQKMLNIEGAAQFTFQDVFTDPADMRSIVAWIRERPDKLLRLSQRFFQIFGFGNGPQGEELDIDQDDVEAIFFAISELGGTAYNIVGDWKADFRASVLIESGTSQYTREKAE